MTRAGRKTNGNYLQCNVSGRNGSQQTETDRRTDSHENQTQTHTGTKSASKNVTDEAKR